MLQGTLSDFSLPDVFSLLALTKKSGALTITADGTDGRVFFRDGLICLALSDAKRVPLGARLVSAGLVDAGQVRAAVQEHTGDSVAVTEALMTLGKVEERVLGVYLREQIIDAVFELMRLDDGKFQFDAAAKAPQRGVGLSVVEVVGEATRRLEEWQAIHRRIASSSAVLAMVPSAAGGREGVSLTAEQWEMLSLIDGRRTVSDVVELTGRGEFATCRVIGDLVTAGLVQAKEPSEQTDLAKLIAAREALRALEDVERTGRITPGLSSAAQLTAGASQTRWVEPPKAPEPQPAPPVTRMPSRTRTAEEPSEPTPLPTPASGTTTQDAAAPEVAHSEEPPAPEAPLDVDRTQVARELASLGADDVAAPGAPADLARDGDLSKGLLLRLIDGVKGA
ncbi:MAG TPA: DUF4388 domain-containing protein [Egibacteraceae bacterium]|nr:DUF4388 domain-containing protein [Egibacteraceae bacterium]